MRAHDAYKDFVRLVARESEGNAGSNAAEMFRQLSRGQSPESVLGSKEPAKLVFSMLDPNRTVWEAFLTSLAISAGSLSAIATIAQDSSAEVQGTIDLLAFRDRTVHVQSVERLTRASTLRGMRVSALLNGIPAVLARQDTLLISARHELVGCVQWNDRNLKSPHEVPAIPWTRLTTSNAAISHLVSVFLAWLNPTWRLIVPDLFLGGERHCQIDK